jgi:hypothetical protein
MSVSKYLEKLIAGEEEPEPDEASVAVEPSQELTPEQEAILETAEAYIASQSQPIADTTVIITAGDRLIRSDRPSDST